MSPIRARAPRLAFLVFAASILAAGSSPLLAVEPQPRGGQASGGHVEAELGTRFYSEGLSGVPA